MSEKKANTIGVDPALSSVDQALNLSINDE